MLLKSVGFIKKQKSLTKLVIYGIGQGFNLVTPLLVIPYIIHVCGLSNYGKAAFGMALTFFLIVFIDYGCEISGVKAVATNRDDNAALQKIFSETYASKLVILIGVISIMTAVFCLVPYFSDDSRLFIFGLPILIGQYFNPTWFLQGMEGFKQITIINILSKLIYLGGIFLFVNSASHYIYINLWWGIGMIIANGFGFIYIVNRYNFRFSNVTRFDVSQNLTNNFSIFYSQILVSVHLYAPLILIGFFGNPLMTGTYRVIDQVIVIFKTYILLFFNFMYPKVCSLLGVNVKEAHRFWLNFNGANLLFVTVSMIFVCIFSESIIAYFNPTDTLFLSHLLKTAVAIPILMAISIPLKQLLLAYDFQKFYVRSTVSVVIANLILILILLPVYEIQGVLLALIIIEIITVLLFFFKIKNRLFLP